MLFCTVNFPNIVKFFLCIALIVFPAAKEETEMPQFEDYNLRFNAR